MILAIIKMNLIMNRVLWYMRSSLNAMVMNMIMKRLEDMNLVDDFLAHSLTAHKTYGEEASRYITGTASRTL